ncbi:hypothetical protein DB345_11200 [Spartobacteria bacterium LR76]|nr:hypothetical protein DB345_11200 [Spartobacteria bacterium LR76]
MKPTILCLTAIIGLSALQAQDAQKPPLPAGPLLKRTGEYSAWTVISQNTAASKSPTDGSAAANTDPSKKDEIPAESRYVKTGDTICEATTSTKGVRQEIWRVAGLRVTIGADHAPLVFPDFGGDDIYSVDFKTSDFAGLNWISPTSYAGIQKWQGRDCIVFQGKVSPFSVMQRQGQSQGEITMGEKGDMSADDIMVPATAYIDVETRLPLFAQFGDEKRTYQYGPAPTAAQQLPAELASQVKEYVARIQRLSAPPTRPF